MVNPTHQNRPETFEGFEPLNANFLYCPNQFFDVCLSHSSRGVVRLVGYLLRRTLGWLDRNGEPIEEEVVVSYRELVSEAGISRGAIRPALDDALAGQFIEQMRSGQANGEGIPSQSAAFRLRWDDGEQYQTDRKQFSGFFAGEGNRTPIPNAFFDHVLTAEPLAVVKVVGAVLRHTVGYQTKFGRRPSAPLSYTYLQRYTQIDGRANLSRAIHRALDAGYIQCIEPGIVHSSNQERKPATYSVRWLSKDQYTNNGSKKKPAEQFKNGTSHGSKKEPAERFKNGTKEKTVANDTFKQQQTAAVDFKAVKRLRESGFDAETAAELSRGRGVSEIEQQLAWLEHRRPERNRLGMLRKAIEENWPSPLRDGPQPVRRRESSVTQQPDERSRASAKRQAERRSLLAQWQQLSVEQQAAIHAAAVESASSAIVRRRLRTLSDLASPPTETLQSMLETLQTSA